MLGKWTAPNGNIGKAELVTMAATTRPVGRRRTSDYGWVQCRLSTEVETGYGDEHPFQVGPLNLLEIMHVDSEMICTIIVIHFSESLTLYLSVPEGDCAAHF